MFGNHYYRKIVAAILMMAAMCMPIQAEKVQSKCFISGVPVINQYPELATGCEATALTMLLNYNGVKVSKKNVADSIPRVSLPAYYNGRYTGGHPSQGFVGTPYSVHSYGVYVEPVVRTIEKYTPGRSINLKGCSFDNVLAYVSKGYPVMVWATIRMVPVTYSSSWYLSDGSRFTWPNNEHALVIVGYNEDYVHVNDPYTGRQESYSRSVMEKRYNQLGKQAVTIKKPDNGIRKVSMTNSSCAEADIEMLGYWDKDHLYIPIKYMKYILPDFKYTYQDHVIYVRANGVTDEVSSLRDGTINVGGYTTHYQMRDNETSIDLVPLKTYLNISLTTTSDTVNLVI